MKKYGYCKPVKPNSWAWCYKRAWPREKKLRKENAENGKTMGNKSGLPDPTAYNGEKAIAEEEQKVADLVWIIKKIDRWAGFEVINRVEVRDRQSGRTYR